MSELLVLYIGWNIGSGVVYFERNLNLLSGTCSIPTLAHFVMGLGCPAVFYPLNVSSQVKLHSSNFGRRLAAFQDFMGNPVLTFNEMMKLLQTECGVCRRFAITLSCADNVMDNPRLLPVVACVLSVWFPVFGKASEG